MERFATEFKLGGRVNEMRRAAKARGERLAPEVAAKILGNRPRLRSRPLKRAYGVRRTVLNEAAARYHVTVRFADRRWKEWRADKAAGRLPE